MKRKATTIVTILFLAIMAAIAIPVSAQPSTIDITFEVEVDVYAPDGTYLFSLGPQSVTVEFMKAGKAYYADTIWNILPLYTPGTPTTGPPLVISQGKFYCWMKYTSYYPDPPLPVVQVFWGELTIDDATMTGQYFDRGYVICEDPAQMPSFWQAIAEQIGDSDVWYLGYSEYTVSAV